MDATLIVVSGFAAASVLLAWGFFRRFQLNRPPLGAFNRTDVVIMLVALVTVPYLYLVLPAWAAATFLGIGVLSVVSTALQPMVRARSTRWAIVATLIGADIVLAATQGARASQFLAVNNMVLLAAVVGTAVLWAQGGMKAKDLALLVAGITIYDVVATTQVSVMADIAERLSSIPFVPFIAWGGPDQGLAIGLGDLLLAAVFPLVMRKAFGRTAGRVALATSAGTLVAILTVLYLVSSAPLIPAMVVLGPAMLVQIAYWRHRQGAERTTWQYLRAEPLPSAA
ncbi:MAG: hypothetical protein ACRD2W_08215 [Acidimicrobiales bacterium]